MGQEVRVAIIGVGKMGILHLEKFRAVEGVKLVGFFDPDDQRAEWVTRIQGVPRFDSLAALLFVSDAAVVSAPTPLHFLLAKQVLDARVHLLLEKPGCEGLDSLQMLVQQARERSLIFQVGFVERFRLRALAEGIPMEGIRFIESHRLTPSLGRDASADVVRDILVHDVDLVLSLVGEEPSHVAAVGVSVITGTWDLANVRLEFSSGTVANLTASRVSKSVLRKFRVFAGRNYSSFDLAANTVETTSVRGQELLSGRREFELDPLALQARDFVSAVRGERPLQVDAAGVLGVWRCLNRITDAMRLQASLPAARGFDPGLDRASQRWPT